MRNGVLQELGIGHKKFCRGQKQGELCPAGSSTGEKLCSVGPECLQGDLEGFMASEACLLTEQHKSRQVRCPCQKGQKVVTKLGLRL